MCVSLELKKKKLVTNEIRKLRIKIYLPPVKNIGYQKKKNRTRPSDVCE